jgi:hypothetical protein
MGERPSWSLAGGEGGYAKVACVRRGLGPHPGDDRAAVVANAASDIMSPATLMVIGPDLKVKVTTLESRPEDVLTTLRHRPVVSRGFAFFVCQSATLRSQTGSMRIDSTIWMRSARSCCVVSGPIAASMTRGVPSTSMIHNRSR